MLKCTALARFAVFMIPAFCMLHAAAITPDAFVAATGTDGGLVVHAGCGDGALTASLRVNSRILVHGLDTDARQVEAARRRLRDRGVGGTVTVSHFDGARIPFVDAVVNSALVDVPLGGDGADLIRVLAPGGCALVRRTGNEAWLSRCALPLCPAVNGWVLLTKPRPADIDEWSHFLHDAGGNAVAHDLRAGPPRGLQWISGPTWCRSHEFPTSVNAVVTAGGRIFTIFDEGITGVYSKLPQRCVLQARNAFSGVTLWRVPMRQWQPEFGTGKGNRWNIHHTIPRRLVAGPDRVYVTLQFLAAPVSVLDAATGAMLVDALPGTTGTDEMILSDGVLVVKTTEERSPAAGARIGAARHAERLAAVDVNTARLLWERPGVDVVPYALCAHRDCVVYHNLDELVCLDLRSGRERWRTPNPVGWTVGAASTLVLVDDIVLFHGHAAPDSPGPAAKRTRFRLTALSLNDGHVLWQRAGQRGLAAACTQPTDLFVTGQTVWCGNTTEGLDLRSGTVVQHLDLANLISPGHHYRCHRGKATDAFLIWPKRGAEFIDLNGTEHMRNNWLRAPCFTGPTPANGLFYVPQDQCFCYPGVKVAGFLAMTPRSTVPAITPPQREPTRGPAHGQVPEPSPVSAADWPMYRHDPQRSGATRVAIPSDLSVAWEHPLACPGTQPVVVGDHLWVVEKDDHCVRCLNVSDGRDHWRYTAGARIDSAPTYHRGTLLFGCRDGTVTCLRATDGSLVWQAQIAPADRRLVAYGQVESVWPVMGSVLVQENTVYTAAGRSSFLDGGILVCAIDAGTGTVRYTHHLEGPWPNIRQDAGAPFAMEGALPDLLVSDGSNLYMQRIKFDPRLRRLDTLQESPLGELDMGANHLVATGGFLDDTGFDRLYWMYSRRWPGFYFAQQAPKSGQLVVFSDAATYAVKYFYRRIQWSPALYPGENGYLLFADAIDNEPHLDEPGAPSKAIEWLPAEAATDKHRRGGRGVEKGTGYVRTQPPLWQRMVPLRIRAMVLAADRLVVAGVPDEVDPADPTAAFEGRRGAVLQIFSAPDGRPLKSFRIPAPVTFDGLAAAHGALYLTTEKNTILCLRQQGPP